MSGRVISYQKGFGAIVAIVVVVILALLAAAIVSVGSAQQVMSAQDVVSARAWHAARAGNEWGLYKALKGQDWPTAAVSCDTASFASPVSETLTLSEVNLYVTVSCGSREFNEGESAPGTPRPVRIYRIRAVACPNSGGCPVTSTAAAGAGYVERTRTVIATN